MSGDSDHVSRAEYDRALQRLDAVERHLGELAQRVVKQLGPTVDEHDDRLDAVEMRVDQMAVDVADIRNEMRRAAAEMTRLADQQGCVVQMLVSLGGASEAQAVVLQQQDRALREQGQALELVLRNTAQTLALLGGAK